MGMTNRPMNFRGIAPMTFQVEFSGTPEQFIKLAWELGEGDMDSLDLGDAMGVFIAKTMDNYYEFDVIRDEFELHCQMVFDSFQWRDIRTPINFNTILTPEDIEPIH